MQNRLRRRVLVSEDVSALDFVVCFFFFPLAVWPFEGKMSPFSEKLEKVEEAVAGAGSSSGAFTGKLERGQSITSGLTKSWFFRSSGVCDTPDHVLGVSVFLLRSPACSRECNQRVSCFLPHQLGVRAFLWRCTACYCCYRWFYKGGIPCPTIAERCPGSPGRAYLGWAVVLGHWAHVKLCKSLQC